MIGKNTLLSTAIIALALVAGNLRAADPTPAVTPAPGSGPTTPGVTPGVTPGAPGDNELLGGPHMQANPKAGVGPVERARAEIRERLQLLRQALQGVNLTDAEKAAVKTMLQDAKTKLDEWRAANQAELAQLQTDLKAARQAKDKDKVAQILGQLKTLLESAPKPEFLKQLKGILKPEQFEKLIARLKELNAAAEKGEAGATTQPAPKGPKAAAHHRPAPPVL
jgi:hypothetical protein